MNGVAPIWVPNIAFPDVKDIQETNFYLKIYPSGKIFFLQHLIGVFGQSWFSYTDYPEDVQDITVRFFHFALTNTQLQFAGQNSLLWLEL